MLLQHGHDGHYAGFASSREAVEFEVGGYEGSGELGIGSRTSTGAPDLRGDIVKLLTILGCSLVSRWTVV